MVLRPLDYFTSSRRPACPLCGKEADHHVYVAWGELGRKGYKSCSTCYPCFRALDGVAHLAKRSRRLGRLSLIVAGVALLGTAGLLVSRAAVAWWMAAVVAALAALTVAALSNRKEKGLTSLRDDSWKRLMEAGLEPPWRSQ